MSPAQTQEMIRFAVRKPALNVQSIVTSGLETLRIGDEASKLVSPSVYLIREPIGLFVIGNIWTRFDTKVDDCTWPCAQLSGGQIQRSPIRKAKIRQLEYAIHSVCSSSRNAILDLPVVILPWWPP